MNEYIMVGAYVLIGIGLGFSIALILFGRRVQTLKAQDTNRCKLCNSKLMDIANTGEKYCPKCKITTKTQEQKAFDFNDVPLPPQPKINTITPEQYAGVHTEKAKVEIKSCPYCNKFQPKHGASIKRHIADNHWDKVHLQ